MSKFAVLGKRKFQNSASIKIGFGRIHEHTDSHSRANFCENRWRGNEQNDASYRCVYKKIEFQLSTPLARTTWAIRAKIPDTPCVIQKSIQFPTTQILQQAYPIADKKWQRNSWFGNNQQIRSPEHCIHHIQTKAAQNHEHFTNGLTSIESNWNKNMSKRQGSYWVNCFTVQLLFSVYVSLTEKRWATF